MSALHRSQAAAWAARQRRPHCAGPSGEAAPRRTGCARTPPLRRRLGPVSAAAAASGPAGPRSGGGSSSGGGGGGGGAPPLYEFQRNHQPVALAFLGDAVWSLYVRRAAFTPPKRHALYLAATQPHVTAEGQAAYHEWLLTSGLLTAEEAALLQWAGRRQDTRMRARFSSGASQATYRRATALEALVGWLHLTDPRRLEQLAGAALAGGAVAWESGGGGGGSGSASES